MLNKEYKEIIDGIVQKKLEAVLDGCEISSGHNGPYYDEEQPGRNISHWICTFSDYYIHTNNEDYKRAIDLLANYYRDNIDYTSFSVYHCRSKQNKDSINGTIGHAWLIQGLVAAYKVLGDPFFIERARAIFKVFPFDEKNGMWERVDIDGKNIGLDNTYNHQLWFAAAGCDIISVYEDPEIEQQIAVFIERSQKTFWVLPGGLICHFANCYISMKQKLKNYIMYMRNLVMMKCGKPSLMYKEIGYHLFNVYAFAIIFERCNGWSFFDTPRFKRSVEYCFSRDFQQSLMTLPRRLDESKLKSNNVDITINTYAFPYNSPAFELPLICDVFNKEYTICEEYLKYEIEHMYQVKDQESGFINNTEDKEVLNARIYELTRSKWFWR